MIRRLVFASVLLLIAFPVLAAEPPGGGGCQLPNLAGLTPDQAALAALEAGFLIGAPDPTPAALQPCPTTFLCSSIGNCGAGACTSVTIGNCCLASGGLKMCCIGGPITVVTCPCHCTASPCNIQCPNSNEVTLHC